MGNGPMGNKAAVDKLDAPPESVSGSKIVVVVGSQDQREAEVIEKIGGPCRGRTYGPLIKSQLLYQLS